MTRTAAPRARPSVRATMATVLAALVPGIVAHTVFFGPGVLLQIVLATALALALEAGMLAVRGRPPAPALGDLSAPLTAVLFALCVPPLAPWWVAATGIATAIVVAKQLFGGLGQNLFNPAMAGVAVAIVCFPAAFASWPAPGAPLDAAATLAAIAGTAPPGWDTLAQATPLDIVRNGTASGATLAELAGPATVPAWGWIAAAHALGGAVLLWRGTIRWHVPAAVLATTVLLSLPAWLSDPDLHPSPLHHLAAGGLVLAAFFVATDPVTGCATPRGRLLFGAGVAAITLAIRAWGALPDGVAFAVLLMNCAAPWIDLHARPRVAAGTPPR